MVWYVFTKQPHWIDESPFDDKIVAKAMFRFQHGHKLELCHIAQTNSGLLVKLANKVKAICAGQFAVFYNGNECLGSAQINAVGPHERIVNESIEKNQLLLECQYWNPCQNLSCYRIIIHELMKIKMRKTCYCNSTAHTFIIIFVTNFDPCVV